MKVMHVLGLFIGVASVLLLLGLLGFRFNLSASLPLGVYRVTSDPPKRGVVVHVCLSRDISEFALRRGYLGPGSCSGGVRPLGKVVLAVEGDVVTLTRDEIRVNGDPVPESATASKDGRGRPLPHFPWGAHRLQQGELWLFSAYHPSAYDSRYFGPVHCSRVVSVLRPVRTRSSSPASGHGKRGHISAVPSSGSARRSNDATDGRGEVDDGIAAC